MQLEVDGYKNRARHAINKREFDKRKMSDRVNFNNSKRIMLEITMKTLSFFIKSTFLFFRYSTVHSSVLWFFFDIVYTIPQKNA